MRSAAASALLALTLVAAGCGGSDDETSGSDAPPPPPPPATTSTKPEPIVGAADVGVYFVRDDELGFAQRSVAVTPLIAKATLEELLAGPTAEVVSVDVANAMADVELSNPLDELGTMQAVQTLTQLETIERVRLEGRE